jgi:uncharacterized lipoprotein YddW (UPF0748 family)
MFIANRGNVLFRMSALGLGLFMMFAVLTGHGAYLPANLTPPEPTREFRAGWIATVKNIDWPSRPGLPVAAQKEELILILDTAARTRLNAVILQIRTACDALYASRLEPWSEYLTGTMGQPPAPLYDPLAFAVVEAHRRGLELHAWFNPYRARHFSAFSSITADHISKTRPGLVRNYAGQLWLDPGEKEVQEHSLRVVLDVVDRYDIDGVHFDDYFYPYPEVDARKQPIAFPDWPTYSRYNEAGGKLGRNDWRRENVNVFVRRVGHGIKQRKPWVKFGISPFGIWRPGHPPSIKGLDAYEHLFADSRLWLREGWCDYFAPQLYWSTDRAAQSFPVLLKWWREQNTLSRHLWPGLAHGNGGMELASQIRFSRQLLASDGHLHWSMKALVQNRDGIVDALRRDLYAQPALLPAYPWLASSRLPQPAFRAEPKPDQTIQFHWRLPPGTNAWLWLVQRRYKNRWSSDHLGATTTSVMLKTQDAPEAIVVRAMDRYGNLGAPAGLQSTSAQHQPGR